MVIFTVVACKTLYENLFQADVNEKEKPFYEDEEEEEEEVNQESLTKRSKPMDPDHRLLLRNAKPLLQSRNAAVRLSLQVQYI